MTILDILQQCLYLTLLGMGIVFAFLVILIVCMILCHKVLHALKLDREPEAPAAATTQASAGNDTAIIAAIATAIHEKQS